MADKDTRTDTWVELRVHGVSGTPPEDLLDRPHVRQVDGDERSRFFRAVDADGEILPTPDGHVIEAFHWGRYTSGSWKQALWLALLPFGLVNLAAFMLPPPVMRSDGMQEPTSVWLRASALGVLRLLALLMTMLLSLAVSLTLIDVVGVRWLATQDWVPDWLRTLATPAGTVVAGLSLLVLGGASWISQLLGRRESAALDTPLRATPVSRAPVDGDEAAAPLEVGSPDGAYLTPFAGADFYNGDPDTKTLRGLHVAAGLGVPAFLAASMAGDWSRRAALALLVVDLVVVMLLGDKGGGATTGLDQGASRMRDPWHRLAAWLAGLGVLVGAVLLVRAAWAIGGASKIKALDANDKYLTQLKSRARPFDEASEYLLYLSGAALTVLALVLGALAVTTWRQRRTRSGGEPRDEHDSWWYFRPYSKGCAALPVAALGLFLGVGYSAAFVTGTSTVLGRRTTGQKQALGSTDMLDRVAYAWALAMLPLVVIGLVLAVQRLRSGRELMRRARLVYPECSAFPENRARAWRKSLAGTIWFARAKNAVDPIVWTLFGAGAVLALAIIVEIGPGWDAGLLSSNGRRSGPFGRLLIQIGTWVLLALIAGLVALARGAFKDATLRRTVNIIWDVVAFWPHAVHPFIPTPYSLRTVGDLAQRVRDHLAATEGQDGRRVVVCGHSQGSLVSFAALSLLSPRECDRVGLLTFGSQLRVIFPRAFPLYVNFAAVGRLHHKLGGAWVNLYRDTDPLAGPVLSWNHTLRGGVGHSQSFPDPAGAVAADDVRAPYGTARCGDDWRLVDPVPRVDREQRAPVNQLHGHSNYWASPEWPVALDEVRRRGWT